jgi:hypothetical protein
MSVDPYSALVGSPSDEVPAILATGGGEITSLYLSLSARHAEGRDAEYLAWHTLDHRPEQYRLSAIRAALRLVSTPACRAARAAAESPFDAVDHVMIYFFSNLGGLKDLAVALRECGRMSYSLPSVQPGIFGVEERLAHPRIKAGADVLPWWPAKGAYLLIEDGAAVSLKDLIEVPGVVGGWQALGQPGPYSKARPAQRTSLLFLDEDPVATAVRLKPALALPPFSQGLNPLLAAPLQIIVPHEWDRYLP